MKTSTEWRAEVGFLSRSTGKPADAAKPAASGSVYEQIYDRSAQRVGREDDLWVARWDPLAGWQREPTWQPLHEFLPFGSGTGREN
jgi:hypothetical protein